MLPSADAPPSQSPESPQPHETEYEARTSDKVRCATSWLSNAVSIADVTSVDHSAYVMSYVKLQTNVTLEQMQTLARDLTASLMPTRQLVSLVADVAGQQLLAHIARTADIDAPGDTRAPVVLTSPIAPDEEADPTLWSLLSTAGVPPQDPLLLETSRVVRALRRLHGDSTPDIELRKTISTDRHGSLVSIEAHCGNLDTLDLRDIDTLRTVSPKCFHASHVDFANKEFVIVLEGAYPMQSVP